MSGRVDNLCYYQQKRVRGGLVRRINLAMSERVKAGEEYVNLRTANSFFGACSMLAACLINFLSERQLFMTRADRQSYATAEIRKLMVAYGRTPESRDFSYHINDTERLALIFNSITKTRATDFFPSLPLSRGGVIFDANMVFEIPEQELENFCKHFKGVGVRVNFYYDCHIYYGAYDEVSQKYEPSIPSRSVNRVYKLWRPGEGDLELIIPAGVSDDTFSSCIIFFEVEKFQENGRPIYVTSAATAHMVGVYFS